MRCQVSVPGSGAGKRLVGPTPERLKTLQRKRRLIMLAAQPVDANKSTGAAA